jgi:hypothetical protein
VLTGGKRAEQEGELAGGYYVEPTILAGALAGLQAAIQTGLLDDKSVRYRVRLGPYDNSDEIARVKTQLAQHGFEATAIRY